MIMKSREFLLPLNLQYFADPDEPNDPPTDPPADPPNDPPPPADPPADPPKTYTQEELEEIIKDRVAREKKAAEKAVDEAKKLAKMNEDQKKEYELEKLKNELEEYKKKDTYNSLSKEASRMLSEHDIVASDELLSFVVKDTAEDTQASVESFAGLVKKKVEEGVKKALAGKPPKVNNNNGKPLTKADIMAEKDAIKRQKLINENIHLFQ